MVKNGSEIMMKIADKEFCSINANEMGMNYDPFSLTLSL